ncbi:hypothetical protein [Croceimicrobium hydrocarbonivorans]|uniref:Uncharacterized protein n=1 Tax=Croceimicrobium hydrocarbonivorans TaxID=2761580 RepID=A0A7H0VEC3_9FLAO|nr:hypothetical protein [Croceimicrobium hydrocarbonivorans]QNR24071.1 hypothetical protein H4K34_17120 [Croceimicrobium hydrocarbonivorans]
MGLITDFLFGRKKSINDPLLGTLTTRVKSTKLKKDYSWITSYLFDHQAKESFLLLEGNALGPFPSQLQAAQSLIKGFESMKSQIDLELQKEEQKSLKYKDWQSKLYLAAIYPNHSKSNALELNFEALDENDNHFFSCTWQDGKISELELK